ncbi:MAG: S24 family peptidase [Verrucomicrobiaceae bacterium]|nr:MAG: S24 family peptidase [Verrucomicrobiaceae bacterium]
MFPVSFPMATMRYAGEVPASEWGEPLQSEIPIEMETKFDAEGRYVCRVVGDSCYPALIPGDLTVWQRDKNPAYGVIVIAEQRNGSACTVKRLAYDADAGRSRLEPINPRYDSPSDGDGWDVIARLVGVVRNSDGPERTWYWAPGLRPRHLTTDYQGD